MVNISFIDILVIGKLLLDFGRHYYLEGIPLFCQSLL